MSHYIGTIDNPIVGKTAIKKTIKNKEHLIGEMHGILIISGIYGSNKSHQLQVITLCTLCMNHGVRSYDNITKGVHSCRCDKLNSKFNKDKPEHALWSQIKQRCDNSKHIGYKNYGGRGVTYFFAWSIFQNFIADMGRRPTPSHQIDRIDNNGNYVPWNCRWATKEENCRNTRNARQELYKGEMKHIYDIAEKEGIPKRKIDGRWCYGVRGEKLWSK